MRVTVLAGGGGTPKLLRGLVEVVDPMSIAAIVNTGDDVVLHGLHVSPDLDSCTYVLSDEIDRERGWGMAGETWQAMASLARFDGGRLAWFRLGDRDLGTHLYRTARVHEGADLATVTAEIARAFGVAVQLLPMTLAPVPTMVTVAGEGEIGFQEYFVGRQHSVAITDVRFSGMATASAGPGVLEAIAGAERVVIGPSNPFVSIGPIVAVPGVAEALVRRRDDVVAVSPIVAGAALKGPADRMMAELGHQPDVIGVARIWAPYCSTLVIDGADADAAGAVEAEGVRCVVAPTIMRDIEAAAALARIVLAS